VAALYLRRFRRRVVLVNSGTPRAYWIPRIRNLIGYGEGLRGPELLARLRKQVARVLDDYVEGEAVVKRRGRGFTVEVNGRELLVKKVILATGMEDEQPAIPNLEELRKKGVLGYCPICDGFDHADEPIALLVKDKHGFEKIPFLARFSPDLHVIAAPRSEITQKCRKLVKRFGARLYRTPILKCEATRAPRGLKIWLRGRRAPLTVRLAYVALGARVRDSAFRHIPGLRRTREGFLLVSYHQETSIKGLFAVGDCVNALAQVSVAVGHAAIAATRVHNELG
jgi:thioredoxin reductase (NADPH)